jgi:hypothetical protein
LGGQAGEAQEDRLGVWDDKREKTKGKRDPSLRSG